MADQKTENQILNLLKEQIAARKDLVQGTKEYEAVTKKINKLEAQKVDLLNKQKQAQKDSTKVAKEDLPIYKQIEASIETRNKKLRTLEGINSAAAKLNRTSIEAQNTTLNLLKHQVNVDGDLTDTMQEQLSVVENLGTGASDLAGIKSLQSESEDRSKLIAEEKLGLQNQLIGLAGELTTEEKKAIQALLKQLRIEGDIEDTLEKNLEAELESLKVMDEKQAKMNVLDKLTGGLASKAKEFKESFQKNPKVAAYGVLAGIIGGLVAAATKFGAKLDSIGKQFGSLKVLGGTFADTLLDSEVAVTKIGFGIEDVASVTNTLASEFGISLDVAAKLSEKVLDTAKATGMSTDEASKLFGMYMQIGGASAEQAEHLAESSYQLARANKVAPNQVLKDIAASSETVAKYTKGTGENLFKAAIMARKLGLNIDTVAKSARGMLDFQDSIQKEMEATQMLQMEGFKGVNIQRARELSLAGDLQGYQKEIAKQVQHIGDLSNLNVLTQESLANAFNMSVPELAKLVSGADKLSLDDALAGAENFEDMLGQESLSNISQLIGSFKQLGAIILNAVGGALDGVVGHMKNFLADDAKLAALKNTFAGIGTWIGKMITGLAEFFTKKDDMDSFQAKLISFENILSTIGNVIRRIAKLLPLIGAGFIAMGAIKFGPLLGGLKGLFILMKTQGLAAVGRAIVMAAGMGPIGIAATVLAATAGYFALKSLLSGSESADDFKSGPGGISYMTGPAGSFKLNPKDSVLATTNPISVNDVLTAPAGNLSPTGNTIREERKRDAARQERESSEQRRHKESMNLMSQGFKNLTAATLAPMPLKFAMMNGEILARTSDRIGGKLPTYG